MDKSWGHGPRPVIGKPPKPIEVTLGGRAVPGLVAMGTKENAVVSAFGPVCRGEFVRKVYEYAPVGAPLRWGLEDVHILDVAEVSESRVGVVFAQHGTTKFKVLALGEDGTPALGNALVLVEDEAVEEAKVLELADGRVMVIYNRDAAGMAAVITLDGRTASLSYTDIWDDQDPANLCACLLGSGRVAVAGMRQTHAFEGECWVRLVEPKVAELTVRTETRVDGGNDTDIYAGGWSLARVTDTTAVLVFPQALDKPVGFAVLDVQKTGDTHTLQTRLITEGKYAASMPTLQAVGLDKGRWMMAYAVGWLSADRRVVKSTLAVEIWGLTRYAAELIWYGCEDTRYAAGVGGVGASSNGVGAAVTYTGEGEARVALLMLLDEPYPGPPVSVGPHDGFCRVVPVSIGEALKISQEGGNGFARAMRVIQTVIPAEGNPLHGIALSGGGPGETITISAVKR